MNKPLLRKIASYVEEHPRQYNQGSWCGTSCCIAGHALVLSGVITRKVIVSGGGLGTIRVGYDLWNVGQEAQEILGIDKFAAADLFAGSWMVDLEDLPTKKAKATAAAKLIRKFIRTGKVPKEIAA